MSGLTGWGVLCGLTLGVGLWSIVSALPRLSRPRLAERVAPYLVDVSEDARALVTRRSIAPLPIIGFVLAPLVNVFRRGSFLGGFLGGNRTIELRLRQSGASVSVDEFRIGQLIFGGLGLAVGLLVTVFSAPVHAAPLLAQLALPVVAAVCGFLLREWILQRAARARLARMESEFPTVVEFLSLSLSAGESILDALRRLVRVGSGELCHEFGIVIGEVGTGVGIAQALRQRADDIRLPVLTRCVEAVTGALERGTPLAEVLRAQAQDARDDAKRELLEVAGKKEVAMLVPLVFLILPTTILFAIFPGVVVLQAGF